MRTCTKCKQEKPLRDFGRKASRSDNTHPWCKDCNRNEARQFYKDHPDPYKKRAKEHKKRLASHLLEFANNLKIERGCFFCQENTLCVLDFHHVIKGSPVTRETNSLISFQTEINKCIIVCANCHRKIHGGLLEADASLIDPVIVPPLPRKTTVDRKTPARSKSNNRVLEFDGQSLTLVEWGEKLNIDPNTLFMRLNSGWSIDKTLTTKKRGYSNDEKAEERSKGQSHSQ